jgi:hypothetical protein
MQEQQKKATIVYARIAEKAVTADIKVDTGTVRKAAAVDTPANTNAAGKIGANIETNVETNAAANCQEAS